MVRYIFSYITRYYFVSNKIGKHIDNESLGMTSTSSWLIDIWYEGIRGERI